MNTFGIALGSNLGAREANLRRGIRLLLGRVPGARVTGWAPVYESAPVACPAGSRAFLNTVIEVEAPLSAAELHGHLAAVEELLGRPNQRAKNEPRTLDLDLLYAGDEVSADPALTLPHPRLSERRFVLQPLADIRPELRLPGRAATVGELLAGLTDDAKSVKWVEHINLADPLPLDGLDSLAARKRDGAPVTVLTAYDYPTARLLDAAGIDMILVGDSLGMVVLGLPDTTGVTMDMMLHHVAAARRGVDRAPVIGDLPIHSYDTPNQALENARRLMAAGADAVKLEGGVDQIAQARAIVGAGIPFVGHIGMLPQSVLLEGGYKKKGKTPADAERLMADAAALDEAGACAIVLESMVPKVAAEITRRVKASTIGIGAGPGTDGQVLVTPDLLGAFPWFRPPFAKARADLAGETVRAVREYIAEVRGG